LFFYLGLNNLKDLKRLKGTPYGGKRLKGRSSDLKTQKGRSEDLKRPILFWSFKLFSPR